MCTARLLPVDFPLFAEYDNSVIMALPRRVRFTDYALMRMKQRDILVEEVRVVIDRPMSSHKRRPDGRAEVRWKIGPRNLLVIYRVEASQVLVINAIWE